MKKFYIAALLALPLLATPTFADGYGTGPGGFNMTFRFGWTSPPTSGACHLGPWYQYWPLEANFITPAPTGYPFWPPPQGLPAPKVAPLPPLPPLVPVVPAPSAPEVKPSGDGVKPASYSYYPYSPYQANIYYGTAPSYWTPRP